MTHNNMPSPFSRGDAGNEYEEFRKWFTAAEEEYAREILTAIPELDLYDIASIIAWPELGGFDFAAFYASWRKVLEARIDGYVYVLRGGGYYKIGRAKKPFERTKTLRIQLPFAVELEHIIACEDYVAAEQAFHEAYDEERVNGEWFRLNKEEVEYIKSWKLHRRYDEKHGYGPLSRREVREIEEFMRRRRIERGEE